MPVDHILQAHGLSRLEHRSEGQRRSIPWTLTMPDRTTHPRRLRVSSASRGAVFGEDRTCVRRVARLVMQPQADEHERHELDGVQYERERKDRGLWQPYAFSARSPSRRTGLRASSRGGCWRPRGPGATSDPVGIETRTRARLSACVGGPRARRGPSRRPRSQHSLTLAPCAGPPR